MVFSACVIFCILTSSPCANAHCCNVAFVKSSPYFLTFIPLVSQYFNYRFKRYGLDYLITHMGLLMLRMVLISILRISPSRYTFHPRSHLKTTALEARHDITMLVSKFRLSSLADNLKLSTPLLHAFFSLFKVHYCTRPLTLTVLFLL